MNKYVLITGASSGIGKAFANYYAKLKNNLVLVARSEGELNKMKVEFKLAYGIDVLVLPYDLSIQESPQRIYNDIKENDIFIHTLVNSAGFASNGTVTSTSWQLQHDQIMLNVVALFDLTKLFLDDMIRANEGKIINVASSTGYHPIPTMAVYAATKAFVVSFTEALTMECKDTNVKVFTISPGATDTNFFNDGGAIAYGKLRTPEHVVETTIKAMNKGKVSKIDGFNNYFTSTYLPRLLSRKAFLHFVDNVMEKQNRLKNS